MAAAYKRLFETHEGWRDDSNFKFRTVKGSHRKWARLGCPDVGVWFLSLTFLFIGCYGYQEQRFAMEPQDQNALIGSRVTLPCRVENKVGALQWTKDDFGLGTHRNLSGYERYSMIGSDEEGDYSLDIRDVTLDDDGRYQCQVSSGLNGEPPIRSRYAQLVVLVAPEPPRIIQGAFIDATEDQVVDIECESSGGKPASEITWVIGNQSVIKKNVKTVVEMLPDGQRFKTRSVLRLTPSKEHHNQTITCQAQNTADRAYRMATVHIEVKYAPKINITISSGAANGRIASGSEARVECAVDANPAPQAYRWFINGDPVVGDYTREMILIVGQHSINITISSGAANGRIASGSEARVECAVDANPAPQAYRWFINGDPVVGDYTREMIIFNVTRKHHNGIVKCEVSNSVGKSEESLSLDVTYAPTFRIRPKNIESELDKTVTLNCDVDGQPKPEIRWIFHEPGRIGVKGKTPDLKIRVTNETVGRYICKASVEGYQEIQSEAIIFIKGAPKILSNRTQFGSIGESARVDCAALSVPKHDDIRWYFEGREINAILDPDYAFLEEYLQDGVVKSSLVIRMSQPKHYGVYNCSVTNEYGNDNAAITLKPYKTLPLFIILVGVTSGIIIFSAFIVLVVMCHRKRRKNQQLNEKPDVTANTSDMYKESDRSSNISDLKMQLHGDGVFELDYSSSDRSQKPRLPLAGPVALPDIRSDPLLHFRYSNDYSDPAYADSYYKSPGGYVYDYPQGYAPPANLRVQSPSEPSGNRSLQGSLTRSIDTTSTLPLSTSNNSQNNSLQRTNKSQDETDAINNLGLPVGGETPPAPIYSQPNAKPQVDVRYAATYGNPYLRNSSVGYHSNSGKPTSTAPPPYSAVRNSVVIPQGNNGAAPAQATHV